MLQPLLPPLLPPHLVVRHLGFDQRRLHHRALRRAVGRRHGGAHSVLVHRDATQRRLGKGANKMGVIFLWDFFRGLLDYSEAIIGLL